MPNPYEHDMPANSAPLAPFNPPSYQIPTGPYGGMPTNNIGMPVNSGSRNVPTFLGLINALRRRWVLAGFLGLLVGTAAFIAVMVAFPQGKHQVKALLEVMMNNQSAYPGSTVSQENPESVRQKETVLIRTRTLVQRVVQAKITKTTAGGQQVQTDKTVSTLSSLATADDPAKALSDMLQIRWDATELMAASVNGDKPDELKIILDTLVTLYAQESGSDLYEQRTKRKEMFLKLKQDYTDKINSLKQLVAGNEFGATDAQIIASMVSTLNTEKTNNSQKIFEAEAGIQEFEAKISKLKLDLQSLEKKNFRQDEIEAELTKQKDASLGTLLSQYDQAKRRYAKVLDQATDKSGELVRRAEQAVKDIETDKKRLTEQRRVDVENQLRVEQRVKLENELHLANLTKEGQIGRRDTLKGINEAHDIQIEKLSREGISASRKMEATKPLEAEVLNIDRHVRELDLLLKDDQGRVKIREYGQILLGHNQKQKMLYSTLAGTLAFLGVITLVAFLEWRSRRVDGVDQVVNEIGLRVIGTIPAFPSRQSIKTGEADANQNWRFILNESVNSTRTMLLHHAKTQSMQVIMVTSAMQGEGKTSLSSQLATSMATAGLRTLILDCDLRNPSMHRLFDLPLAPGCSEILLSELDVSDAVQPTTVPNLWIIPAGQCSNRVIAALAQGHPLESLFNRLRGQFDFIVVDTCPVLPVADSLLIGQHVDGVLMSILQDISQLPKVLNASERLSQLNIPLLGAVVNGIKTDIHAYGYNYVKQLPA
jgi:polysaccharide biosynthesis transport protein